MKTQIKSISFKGKNIFIGIDVHLKSWTATILSESTHLKTYRLDPSPDALYSYLSKTYPNANYHSVYEAGFSGYGAHRRLVELGVDNIVVNPADVPTTGREKLRKTDAVDSSGADGPVLLPRVAPVPGIRHTVVEKMPTKRTDVPYHHLSDHYGVRSLWYF